MKVSVIGLGYVGLPLAKLCAEKYETWGIDVDKNKLNSIKDLENLTTDYKVIKNSDVACVCVPTPVDSGYIPNLTCIENASKSISENLRRNHLIIIESTINPGMTEGVIKPILEKSGLKAEIDFYLAHCPERINPGDTKWNIKNIPRVIGALSKIGLEKAVDFYSSILDAPITKMSSIKAAEAVKIVENSFRDVNIAFVNELAKSFDKFGIDTLEVINGASTKPFGFMPHYPGCGVGGHCIPVDPYYLIEEANKNGFDHSFLKLARKINNSMPAYTISLLIEELNKLGKSVKNSKIGILGLAYKAGVSDIRESPSLEVIRLLEKLEAKPFIYDPYVKDKSNVASVNEILKKVDCLMLLTDHPEFKNLDVSNLELIIDGRNFLDKNEILSKGIKYRGIGR